MSLSMTDAAIDHTLSEAYDPELGARPLRRFLEKHVVAALSRHIIAGELLSGQQALVDEQHGKLQIHVTGGPISSHNHDDFQRADSTGSYTRRSEADHSEGALPK